MKVSEQFAGSYFRAEDFDKKGRDLKIESVELEDVGNQSKIVIHFIDEEKTLPVNKTNGLTLGEILGDDTDDWAGNKIRIYRDTTMFNGKRVSCMRVSSPKEE